jgi:hypothetical protein
MIKRRQGASVRAVGFARQSRALLLKVLTHNILILKRTLEVFYRAVVTPFLVLFLVYLFLESDPSFYPDRQIGVFSIP